MKVIVAGGRAFKNRKALFAFLDDFHAEHNITFLIEGDAGVVDRQGRVLAGADKFAGEWAKSRGVRFKKFKADWDKYGKRAGWVRNSEMADQRPDHVILFPGGKGTAMMLDIAKRRKIPHTNVKC